MVLLYPSPWEQMGKEWRELTVEEQRLIVKPGAGERKPISAKATISEEFEFSGKPQLLLRSREAVVWKNLERLAGMWVPLGFSGWNLLYYFWKSTLSSVWDEISWDSDGAQFLSALHKI